MEKFNYEANGYNKEEVNKFVDEVARNTKEIVEKCLTYEEKIEKLEKELGSYREQENKIKLAVEKADLLAENTKKMAEKEAEVIIQTAKDNASVIINDSLINTQKLELKKEMLEDNMDEFRKRLKVLIEQQKVVVDELDKLDIKSE